MSQKWQRYYRHRKQRKLPQPAGGELRPAAQEIRGRSITQHIRVILMYYDTWRLRVQGQAPGEFGSTNENGLRCTLYNIPEETLMLCICRWNIHVTANASCTFRTERCGKYKIFWCHNRKYIEYMDSRFVTVQTSRCPDTGKVITHNKNGR
jgi:hypothetical protein